MPVRRAGPALLCLGVLPEIQWQSLPHRIVDLSALALSHWFLLLLLAPLAYYLLCLYAMFDFRRRRPRWPVDHTPPISILKPVRGLEDSSYENFASFCRQDYPLYEIVFCVREASDPAVPVIEQVMRDFPECSTRLLVGRENIGLNPKANKLCRLVREAKYDLLVSSDADVRVGPGYLRSVAAPFSDPNVGAVSAFFQGRIEGGFVSRVQSLGYVADFWTQGIVSHFVEDGFKWATGASLAISRHVLTEIGGYESVADSHSEDLLLVQDLTARGYRVEFASEPVGMLYPHQSFGAFFRHQILWSLRLRHVRPAGHFGLLFTFGLPWAVLACILGWNAHTAEAILAGYLLFRSATIIAMGRGVLRDPLVRRTWFLFPLCDALAFAVWLASFFQRRMRWQDREYVLGRGARLALPPVLPEIAPEIAPATPEAHGVYSLASAVPASDPLPGAGVSFMDATVEPISHIPHTNR